MKTEIHSVRAPKQAGPYSQAIAAGRHVFFAGQIAVDYETGDVIPGDAAAHAVQALKNLGAVLEAAGMTYGDVVKTTLYLAHIEDFEVVNKVYATFFEQPRPARATVAVSAIPRGSLVEVDAFGIKDE